MSLTEEQFLSLEKWMEAETRFCLSWSWGEAQHIQERKKEDLHKARTIAKWILMN